MQTKKTQIQTQMQIQIQIQIQDRARGGGVRVSKSGTRLGVQRAESRKDTNEPHEGCSGKSKNRKLRNITFNHHSGKNCSSITFKNSKKKG